MTLSGDQIARQSIDNLRDIGLSVPNPNLSMRTDGFPNATIRGIGGFGNTQGVGFYLDDVQVFSDASSRFGDLDRIEVLKGPQGTRYGGSNIGGAVKFVSARPEEMDVFTQELRFTSTTDGSFSWLAGAYYSLYAEKMRSTQIWWDTRVDADGNMSGALGCAIGMPICSGVWTGQILAPPRSTSTTRTAKSNSRHRSAVR